VLKWVCRNCKEFKNPNPEYKSNQKKKKGTRLRSRSRCSGNELAENVIAGE
jgi:hypothetical protein